MINCIQIGAHSGWTKEEEDIIWPIVRDKGWNCIFIEPMTEPFIKLKENYKDLTGSFFENVAIMDYNGMVNINYAPEGDLRIASCSKITSRNQNTSFCSVRCCTLLDIITKYNMIDKRFELLQIDTEGLDGKIICSTDFTHILPRYIRFEHCHLIQNNNSRENVIKHLSKFGYSVTLDIFTNKLEKERDIDTLMERSFEL